MAAKSSATTESTTSALLEGIDPTAIFGIFLVILIVLGILAYVFKD